MHGLRGLLQGALIGRLLVSEHLGLPPEVGQEPPLNVRVVTFGLQPAELLLGVDQFLLDLRQFQSPPSSSKTA
jgi:hypothetical protein